jgi:hypothetical protein
MTDVLAKAIICDKSNDLRGKRIKRHVDNHGFWTLAESTVNTREAANLIL